MATEYEVTKEDQYMDKISNDTLLLSYKKARKLEQIDEKFIELLKKEIRRRNFPHEQ